jgi:GTP-binding protein
MSNNLKLRNIAIIAHVDHGKTTLVDGLIKQTLEVRGATLNQTLIMDNLDQEKERGITITAKNASIYYKDYKINLVDTPGHADFGGEVERALKMVDGACLLVDAQEGPMPQTKYVMKKAIALGLKVLVIVNKVDKPAANSTLALSKIEDLFLDLGASDEQIDFPVVYASGVQGKAGQAPDKLEDNLFYFLEKVVEHIPEPKISTDQEAEDKGLKPLQILVLNLKYDTYKGKLAVGKIELGKISKNQSLIAIQKEGKTINGKVASLMIFDGLGVKEVDEAQAGEIVMVAGFENIDIGDTITTADYAKPLERINIDEPTLKMTFGVNTSPLNGREGDLCTSRQIKERLYKELETNVALKVEPHPESGEKFIVSGRGELHLSVLIEEMRRQGFELEISKPEVIFKYENGVKLEPFEMLEIDVPQEYQGVVLQELGKRNAEVKDMSPNEVATEFHFEARMATRSLIGLKGFLITATKGTAVVNSTFDKYDNFKDSVQTKRDHGSLVSTDKGKASSYALYNAQERGVLFIGSGEEVYTGMVVGESNRSQDIELNPTKEKKLTNVRSKSSDEALTLSPHKTMTLEKCIEYIDNDELVEITPKNLRIRKRHLDPNMRKRQK